MIASFGVPVFAITRLLNWWIAKFQVCQELNVPTLPNFLFLYISISLFFQLGNVIWFWLLMKNCFWLTKSTNVSLGLSRLWLVMGSGQFFVSLVGSDQPSWVWIWKISPKNIKFFKFSPSDQKKSLRVRSKSTQVGLLFTTGQK